MPIIAAVLSGGVPQADFFLTLNRQLCYLVRWCLKGFTLVAGQSHFHV
jgi:hypothetical protein